MVRVQSASIARSQGLLERIVEVPQAFGPFFSCCAAKQEEICKWDLQKHFLANIASELLTRSVTKDIFGCVNLALVARDAESCNLSAVS